MRLCFEIISRGFGSCGMSFNMMGDLGARCLVLHYVSLVLVTYFDVVFL